MQERNSFLLIVFYIVQVEKIKKEKQELELQIAKNALKLHMARHRMLEQNDSD